MSVIKKYDHSISFAHANMIFAEMKKGEDPCASLHGHNASLEVEVKSTSEVDSVEMPFGDAGKIVKEVIEKLDHSLIAEENDPYMQELAALQDRYLGKRFGMKGKVVWLQQPPTSEVICRYIANYIKNRLPEGIVLTRIRFEETPRSIYELNLT
ncbi:6-pyruvoyl trahydropterin synthase family protein [Flammeovirga agarivorans]|uniref:6-carboxy-5,6,7,8-tetrahydropterin synthase n=1 Tax=Flammeovirga agarivorans TaxID=2726742 RepID=A0A7X8SRA6_9BACT|nr:6-carboxytetrahydropterin synthase [Flammeovirga agarivorans]NLR94911.1 hypothetical protein [Flammeovirga agarivorans]